jgi:hypothetical protein
MGNIGEKYMRKIVFSLPLVVCIFHQLVQAQDVIIDWKTKKLTASPAEISKAMNVQVLVQNVNDVLYEYEVQFIRAPRDTGDDYRALLSASGVNIASARSSDRQTCGGLITLTNLQITAAREQTMRLSPVDGAKVKSISLNETITKWGEIVEGLDLNLAELAVLVPSLSASRTCTEQEERDRTLALLKYDALIRQLDALRKKLNSPHQITRTEVLSPDNDYTVIIREFYLKEVAGITQPQRILTEGGEHKFTFSPISNLLVVSAGALLTQLEQRSYLNRLNPATGKNVLAIDGAGVARPIGIALLNYQAPFARFGKEQFGLNLSSGLTFELGATKSDTSRLGWFGGISLDLYHRLYITPGIHFGQFADFPTGFGNGSEIPQNFGELNPVKRWTGRFAIAITYRTAGIGKKEAK